MLLAGDIGGTKTVLAVFSLEQGPNTPLVQKTYPSASYPTLEAMVQEFLEAVNLTVESACFGVAGPVFAGRAHITNLPWVIDTECLLSTFGWRRVHLINDLEAVAYAIPILKTEDVYALSAGSPVPGGNLSVLAPGTGLGEAYVTVENGHFVAHACEGSHASFAPTDALQIGLLRYLWKQGYEHVSVERVCSGALGIPNLYAYLKDSGYAEEPAWLADALASCDDPTPVIMSAAMGDERPSALCRGVLDLFTTILGSEAGNQALKIMATGGIYLGGGIPPRILAKLKEPAFLDAIRRKGRFQAMLAHMPVMVILNAQAGLLGAAAFGFDRQSA
jgi:glucokinase